MILLQARRPGGEWMDIFPAQLGWIAKSRAEVRALDGVAESPPVRVELRHWKPGEAGEPKVAPDIVEPHHWVPGIAAEQELEWAALCAERERPLRAEIARLREEMHSTGCGV